jgi:putative PEP-CTERM system TPR-repeat lipoprotein
VKANVEISVIKLIQSFLLLLLFVGTTFPSLSQEKKLEYFEDAKSAFDQGDIETAYIYLKNALQEDPAHLPSKLLMGQLLLVNGYTNEAIIEFNEALEFDADYNLVVIPLAQAYILLGNNQGVLDLTTSKLVQGNVFELSLLKGNAASNIGDSAGAQYWYQQALSIRPDSTRAINSFAGHLLEYNQIEQAAGQINLAISLAPESSRAWHLRGKLEQQSKNFETALQHYQKSYSLDKQDPLIKRSLASVYVELGDYRTAQEYLAEILAQTPDDPNALVLKARILALTSEDELSRQALEDISQKLSVIENDVKAKRSSLIFLAGLTAYLAGNFEVALNEFELYVQSNPGNLNAITLLADTHFKLGQSKLALDLLEDNERIVTNNQAVSIILCDLYLANGKSFKCDSLIGELKEIYGDSPALLLVQAKSLQQRGRYTEALAFLNDNLPNKGSAAALLVYSTLYMQLEKPREALERINKLIDLSSQNLYFLNLKSEVLIKLQNFEAASKIINAILSQEPLHYSALLNQARIHFLTAKLSQAEATLLSILEINDQNIAANILMGQTKLAQSRFDEALTHLEFAKNKDLTNTIAQGLIIETYIQQKDYAGALLEVNELLKSDLLNPNYLEQKAEILLALDRNEDAKTQLNLLFGQWQNSPNDLLRLSQLQLRTGDFTHAENSITRALDIAPDSVALRVAYSRLLLQISNTEKAQPILDKLISEDNKNPDALLLIGDLHFIKEDFESARKFYLSSYKQANHYKLALIKLYQLANQGVGASTFAENIEPLIKAYPDNHFQKHIIADFLLVNGEHEKAASYYMQLVKVDDIPNKHDIFNNLANIYLSSDLALAKSFANQAEAIKRTPEVLDTKGWILTKEEKYDEALDLLRQAYARQSNDPAIRYHIGFTLEKMGRTQEAKRELGAALQTPSDFAGRANAQTLYNSLL